MPIKNPTIATPVPLLLEINIRRGACVVRFASVKLCKAQSEPRQHANDLGCAPKLVESHRGRMNRPPTALPIGPGQESVWDYPRPAVVEATSKHLKVIADGVVIAETLRGYRALETSHPPTYYFPPEHVRTDLLHLIARQTMCEWKGQCTWFDLAANGAGGAAPIRSAAWSYRAPTETFAAIAGYIAFFARPMDRCTVDGVVALPQEGEYYGGWITPDVVGPFKGGPETRGW